MYISAAKNLLQISLISLQYTTLNIRKWRSRSNFRLAVIISLHCNSTFDYILYKLTYQFHTQFDVRHYLSLICDNCTNNFQNILGAPKTKKRVNVLKLLIIATVGWLL